MTLWSVNFSMELKIEDICNLTYVLFFYLYSFYLCRFMFFINMKIWVLMAEIIGYTFLYGWLLDLMLELSNL